MAHAVGAHLVGTIPLSDAENVLRTLARVLGDRLHRIPDGETGPRQNWVWSQVPVLEGSPDLERVIRQHAGVAQWPVFRIAANTRAHNAELGELGYRAAARYSYHVFADLKRRGVLPQQVRFQVGMPTPANIAATFVDRDSRSGVEQAYQRAMERELVGILADIPHSELAIQWENCAEVLMLAETSAVTPWFADPWAGIAERVRRLTRGIPDAVEVGFHFCYGNLGGRRSVDLADARLLVQLANLYTEAAARPIGFVHLPVRDDVDADNYLRPLSGLALAPRTGLYLGLIDRDSVGARDRIAAAHRHVRDREFGVAAECGMGRRPAEQVPALLETHRRLAAPIRLP